MRYGILGPVVIWAGDRALSVERPLRRAVLAYLLLHANRVVSLERLIDAVWGATMPASASAQIRSAVFRIRQALREAELADALATHSAGYLFAVEPGLLDLDVFEAHVARARAAMCDGRHPAATDALREALLLCRGPALSGTAAEFVDATRARLHDQRLGAHEDLMECELALGRHAEVLAQLQALVGAHPLRERLSAQLMLALYRGGRQADALAAFHLLRGRLAEQLGVDPGREVSRLYEAIVRADHALDRPPAATPRPAVATYRPAVAAQLPPPVADFTGRADELDALDAMVNGGPTARAVVICAIAGTAGVGKTALAVSWGHRVRHRFPDGQLFVNLRGYAPGTPVLPIEALGHALRALHVPAEQVPLELDEAAALYRSVTADRRILVLLDNAASAEQVRPLLAGGPGSLVLVTSRDRLDGLVARDGARRVGLDVLPAGDAVELLTRIVGAGRVAAEPEAAAGLARACAYLPLALRIAAADLAGHPHRTLAGQLADLDGDSQLARYGLTGDEQGAVRAAFDPSYAALDAEEQRVFRLLGAAPGVDVTPEAMAALAAVPPARAARLLDRLTAVHLVEQHAAGRYTCHDLLRRYACGHASRDGVSGDSTAALGRLLSWYLHSADAAANTLLSKIVQLPLPPPDDVEPTSFADPTTARAWLDAERTNLIAAMRHAADHGPRGLSVLLAHSLSSYFQQGAYVADWLATATAAVAAAEAERDPRPHAAAELNLGRAHSYAARYDLAAERYAAALALARRIGWHEMQTAALGNLGNVCHELGRLTEAAQHQQAIRTLARRIGSTIGEAAALNNLGLVYHAMGRLQAAHQCLTQALILPVPGRYGAFAANARATLAAITRDLGSLPEALDLARAALASAQDAGDRNTEAEVLNILATIHRHLGQHGQAIDHHEQALRLASTTGNRHPQIEALVGLAAAHRLRGDPQRSLDLAREASIAAGQVGSRQAEGQALATLAEAQLATGHGEAARHNAERAVHLHRVTGHQLDEARSLVTLGHAHSSTDGPRSGLRFWRQAADLFADIDSPEAEPTRALCEAAAVTK